MSSEPSKSPSSAPRNALKLFAALLAERGLELDETAVERLCAEHTELAGELRELWGHWSKVAPLLPRSQATGSSITDRLKALYGEAIDPGVSLEAPTVSVPAAAASGLRAPSPPSAASADLLGRIGGRAQLAARYSLVDELGRGGMGVVYDVWDVDLRRHVAMKVIRTPGETAAAQQQQPGLPPLAGRHSPAGAQQPPAPPASPSRIPIDPESLGRFLEEAQITAQLNHPGIVPIHEIGLDPDGRVYFSMRLVRGATFGQVIERVSRGEHGWTLLRALSVLIDVCDALAFAHDKGVIHRDLKPGNVMVGRFGETYVMDWGLARVLALADRRDLRLRGADQPPLTSVHTERRDAAASRDDSPLVTMDGAVVGTPAYMPPEQALGQIERIDKRSDVYAAGAMLYHLLARRMPYVEPGARVSPRTVLAMVQMGPPRPVHKIRDDVPAELQAICEKAMARDPDRRYRDMQALAEDLRAYVEHRVVQAYETGALAELRKWVERNRALAASLAAAVLLAIGGASLVAWQGRRHGKEMERKNLELSARSRDLEISTAEANAARAAAEDRLAEVKRLADIKRARDLERRAAELWPAWPGLVPRMKTWIADAEEIAGRLDLHRRSLDELRAALPSSAGGGADSADAETQWWHEQLVELIAAVEALARPLAIPSEVLAAWKADPDEEPPAAAFVSAEATLSGMRRRIDHAAWVEEVSLDGQVDAWREAIERVSRNPKYAGLPLAERIGLVPIGVDPQSGLEEFWHVESGARPRRDPASGRVAMDGEAGMVLVLLPGGRFTMGVRPPDAEHPPGSPNVDPECSLDEQPPHEVELSPFLLSRFEMTQAQWLRAAGANPAWFVLPGQGAGDPRIRPVESVSWSDAAELLARIGATLPTEAQWEYAARGGTASIWWCGDERSTVERAGNVADAAFKRGVRSAQLAEEWDDGFERIAPVGRFAPNGFGLHDVIGNLWELCADEFADLYRTRPARHGDGLRGAAPRPAPRVAVARGGGWNFAAALARSAQRQRIDPTNRTPYLGVRPARILAE
jgi:formylglycine-generating enzyme required for sulfatase activity/serine/threonine protein kinase